MPLAKYLRRTWLENYGRNANVMFLVIRQVITVVIAVAAGIVVNIGGAVKLRWADD